MAQYLNDKDWLEKVSIAYAAYKQQHERSPCVESFISWLYKQYGIIEPKDNE